MYSKNDVLPWCPVQPLHTFLTVITVCWYVWKCLLLFHDLSHRILKFSVPRSQDWLESIILTVLWRTFLREMALFLFIYFLNWLCGCGKYSDIECSVVPCCDFMLREQQFYPPLFTYYQFSSKQFDQDNPQVLRSYLWYWICQHLLHFLPRIHVQ